MLHLEYGQEGETHVCRLLKSLYGFKQASRNQYLKLSSILLSDGFTQSAVDHYLFTETVGFSFTVILVYVNDILVARNDLSAITALKTFLDDRFKINDLGTRKYTLDILTNSGCLGS